MKNIKLKEIEKDSASLRFLYKTMLGRLILKVLTLPFISIVAGKFLDCKASCFLIKNFIKKNNIDMSDYKKEDYQSFNDFFTRNLKEGSRIFEYDEKSVFCPSDGLLSVFRIDDFNNFKIKQSIYNVETLLQNKELAKEFKNGYCLIFRLCVNHYHRYNFTENGKILKSAKIKGKLHTVRPIAIYNSAVYHENAREYVLIDSNRIGRFVQMEVGAMMVGKIDNYPTNVAIAKKEKGKFLFGGSTIIMLIQDNKIKLDQDILNIDNSKYEIEVKLGQKIGEIMEA